MNAHDPPSKKRSRDPGGIAAHQRLDDPEIIRTAQFTQAESRIAELLCLLAQSTARIEKLLRGLQPLAPFTFKGSSRS
jgi:hypothetical protein